MSNFVVYGKNSMGNTAIAILIGALLLVFGITFAAARYNSAALGMTAAGIFGVLAVALVMGQPGIAGGGAKQVRAWARRGRTVAAH